MRDLEWYVYRTRKKVKGDLADLLELLIIGDRWLKAGIIRLWQRIREATHDNHLD